MHLAHYGHVGRWPLAESHRLLCPFPAAARALAEQLGYAGLNGANPSGRRAQRPVDRQPGPPVETAPPIFFAELDTGCAPNAPR